MERVKTLSVGAWQDGREILALKSERSRFKMLQLSRLAVFTCQMALTLPVLSLPRLLFYKFFSVGEFD